MSLQTTTTRNAATHSFKQDMQTRHIVMLALGGVIGTGLFLTSGYTVNQAGPLGAVIAYILGAIMVYLVMMCLGELAVHMPEVGSFSSYATRYIGPGTGYMVAWMYWLTWTVAIGSEFTAAGILMVRWFPETPVWLWSALFGAVVFFSNIISVRSFAETEFWLSLIKVLAVVAFLVIGGGAILGVFEISQAHSVGLGNFTREGLFPTGFWSIAMTLLAVAFAFSGTELIGIAAGETRDPEKNVPKAIRTTVLRLALFFVGTIFVLATLLPREQAGVVESPFVMVFAMIGIPYAADIMNFVIITALLSAANSGLYAAARMLWTLSDQGNMPRRYAALSRRGTPFNAIVLSMAGGMASLLSGVFAPTPFTSRWCPFPGWRWWWCGSASRLAKWPSVATTSPMAASSKTLSSACAATRSCRWPRLSAVCWPAWVSPSTRPSAWPCISVCPSSPGATWRSG